MAKMTTRLVKSAALGVALMSAAAASAHAQQPGAGAPAPATPPAPDVVTTPAPAEPATPAVEASPAEPAPIAAPAEPKKDEPPAIAVSYDKGIKFESEDGQFEGKLSLRTQFRWDLTKPTDDGKASGTAGVASDDWVERFFIARARVQREGHLFTTGNYQLAL
jgi:hypothetical protein